LATVGQLHNFEEMEETLQDNLWVCGMLVVFSEQVRIIHKVLFDLQVIDWQKGHTLIEILSFLKIFANKRNNLQCGS
jgi:hypothetical protein